MDFILYLQFSPNFRRVM